MNRRPTVQLRRLVTCLDGQRVPLNAEQRSAIPGKIPYWGANGVVDHINAAIFDEELVLLGEDGAPFGDPLKDVAFLVNGPTWINNHIHVLRPIPGTEARFLRYALNTVDWPMFISGSTRDKLTQEDMKRTQVPRWEHAEQRTIADFLDDETARIDALIAKKRRMIELIQGRAVSTASVAAWGAGNKDHTPIQAIGPVKELPRGWRVLRNKVFLREISERSSDGSEELLSVSHMTGVTPRSEKNVTMFMAESLEGYKRVQPGDLVINTMWAWMGAAGVSRLAGIVSPAYGAYRFDRSVVLPGYYDILIRTPEYITEMTRFSRGVWTSRLRLYPDEFLRLSAPVPPLGEQAEIVERVTAAGSLADRINTTLTRAVELLTERRQALVTAAVTGELDVARHPAKAAS